MIFLIPFNIANANEILDIQDESLPSPQVEEDRIINGDGTTNDVFPMTGGMLMRGELFGNQMDRFVCSSTLIAPDVVLIAAHCIDEDAISFGVGVDDMEMYWTRESDLTGWDGNSTDPILPSDAVKVKKWIAHPSFNLQALGLGLKENFDIGLLFLEEPVLDVNPAYLPSLEEAEALGVNDTMYVVGWGQQTATQSGWGAEPPPPGTYAIKQVGKSYISEINTYEIKVGEIESDVRKCHGDSGGPSFWEADYGLRLVGVTSHAYDNSDCFETGGVDTRVDYYLDWINDEMTAGCTNGIRVWCEQQGIPPYGYFIDESSKVVACSTTTNDAFWLLPMLGLVGLSRRSRVQ